MFVDPVGDGDVLLGIELHLDRLERLHVEDVVGVVEGRLLVVKRREAHPLEVAPVPLLTPHHDPHGAAATRHGASTGGQADTETSRRTDRRTGRRTGRRGDRQADRQTRRPAGGQTGGRGTGRRGDRQADRQRTGGQADVETGRWTETRRPAGGQAGGQTETGRRTDRWTDRQADRQMRRQTDDQTGQ